MRQPPTGELPQRVLALELRYAIDVARVKPTGMAFDRVKALVEANPHGVTSRHIEHNLGVARNEWLRRNKLLWTHDPFAIHRQRTAMTGSVTRTSCAAVAVGMRGRDEVLDPVRRPSHHQVGGYRKGRQHAANRGTAAQGRKRLA